MFYKAVDHLGRSYTAGENFTDTFAPAMNHLGLSIDDVKFDHTVQRNLRVEKRPHSQQFATAYEMSVCRRKSNNEIVLTIYSAENKQTLIKAASHDKQAIRKFASVAKSRKGKR